MSTGTDTGEGLRERLATALDAIEGQVRGFKTLQYRQPDDMAGWSAAALATPPTAEAALPEGWRPIMVVTAEEERCPTCGRTDRHAHYWNDPRYHKAPR